MNTRATKLIASAFLVATLASACGGGRPSVDEVADGIKDNSSQFGGGVDIDDEMAKCIAEAFHDSDLSDDALQAIADGDEDYEASDEDNEAMTSVSTESVTECMDIEMPEVPDTELPTDGATE